MNKQEKKFIFEELERLGQMNYGHMIDREILKDLFHVDTTDYTCVEYFGKFESFRQYVERKMNVFCKFRGGHLYVSHPNETGQRAKSKRQAIERKQRQAFSIVEGANYKIMNPQARAEAVHEKRILDMLRRDSKLIRREIEYYEVQKE